MERRSKGRVYHYRKNLPVVLLFYFVVFVIHVTDRVPGTVYLLPTITMEVPVT